LSKPVTSETATGSEGGPPPRSNDQKKVAPTQTARTVPIQRITIVTHRRFDDVVNALHQGIGHPPDMAALVKRWNSAGTSEELDRLAAEAEGSSGLMQFLTLDLGAVLAIRYPGRHYRMVRFIIGNPVTMSDMAVSVPDVGSYAPVTVLVTERRDGVHLSYDSMVSAIAHYDEPTARAVAERLDAAVLQLMHQAAAETEQV
jgi:hypothetical protein